MSTTIFVIISIKSSILGTSVKLCSSLRCGDTDQPSDFAMTVITQNNDFEFVNGSFQEIASKSIAGRYPLNEDYYILHPQFCTLTFNFRLHYNVCSISIYKWIILMTKRRNYWGKV